LQATATDPNEPPVAIELPPVQVVSPPIAIRHGQLVRIHGWVRVPQAIGNSRDGLMVYDTLAGSQLADRIDVAEHWREFVLYRAASVDGPMSIAFALTGIGDAYIDDVTISVHESIADRSAPIYSDEARRLPPVTNMVR
jgi:hypothetical protein